MSKQKFNGKTLYTKTLVDNIINIFEQSEEDDVSWYDDALLYAKFLFSRQHDLTVPQIVGIIAALSPQKSWQENKRLARDFVISGKQHGTTQAFLNKARDIAKLNKQVGRTVTMEAQIVDILNGEKIKAFFLNILYPQKNTGVTVDRHTIEIAVGHKLTNHRLTVKQYQFFQRAYMLASIELNYLPHEIQAMTWVFWRQYKKQLI